VFPRLAKPQRGAYCCASGGGAGGRIGIDEKEEEVLGKRLLVFDR